MSAVSRPVVLWSSAEHRARVYQWLAAASVLAMIGSWTVTVMLLRRPREVVRIGCDGIPAVVRINDQVYSEADEREIRHFVSDFAVKFMRFDSYSIVNDVVDCSRKMTPELREKYKDMLEGHGGQVEMIQSLHRRTRIDPEQLEIEVDKSVHPFRAVVRGQREVVGQKRSQPWELDLELVSTSRDEVLEGLLVYSVEARDARSKSSDVADAGVSDER